MSRDVSVAGTIDIRRAPDGKGPTVINLFAQWEMGAPGKYNRVKPATPSDSAPAREAAFKECLGKIAALQGGERYISAQLPFAVLLSRDFLCFNVFYLFLPSLLVPQLSFERRPNSVAFPHEIGCGLAGGNWPKYESMIKTFATQCPDIRVSICRWTGGGAAAVAGGAARAGAGAGNKSRDVCFHCKEPGHWASQCPKKKR